MTWSLFLDDIRDPSYVGDGCDYFLARTFDQAIKLCEEKGMPSHISFDHDLGDFVNGVELTGYDFAKWLVEQDLDGLRPLPEDFTWYVHSSNPVGKKNIDHRLSSYLEYKKTQ